VVMKVHTRVRLRRSSQPPDQLFLELVEQCFQGPIWALCLAQLRV